jgi:hypothetical protein
MRRVWGAVSAYGYQPWRAIAVLLVLIWAGAVVFGDAPMAELGSDERVVFYPWLYAADLAIPFLDLQQAGDYQPRDSWAQWWMWGTIAFGWFLSGAFIAAVTGLFKPDD